MVRNCLGSAGTGAGGQLAAGRPAILVVTGFLLSQETFDVLQHGTEVVLQTQKPRRPDLLGIALFNLWQRVDVVDGGVQVLLEEQSRLVRSPALLGSTPVWSATGARLGNSFRTGSRRGPGRAGSYGQ